MKANPVRDHLRELLAGKRKSVRVPLSDKLGVRSGRSFVYNFHPGVIASESTKKHMVFTLNAK